MRLELCGAGSARETGIAREFKRLMFAQIAHNSCVAGLWPGCAGEAASEIEFAAATICAAEAIS
jgi:hypothetical protein